MRHGEMIGDVMLAGKLHLNFFAGSDFSLRSLTSWLEVPTYSPAISQLCSFWVHSDLSYEVLLS